MFPFTCVRNNTVSLRYQFPMSVTANYTFETGSDFGVLFGLPTSHGWIYSQNTQKVFMSCVFLIGHWKDTKENLNYYRPFTTLQLETDENSISFPHFSGERNKIRIEDAHYASNELEEERHGFASSLRTPTPAFNSKFCVITMPWRRAIHHSIFGLSLLLLRHSIRIQRMSFCRDHKICHKPAAAWRLMPTSLLPSKRRMVITTEYRQNAFLIDLYAEERSSLPDGVYIHFSWLSSHIAFCYVSLNYFPRLIM